MNIRNLCICLFIVISFKSTASAYFMDFANGVRPSGMGEAFVAVADDSNSALFNPAGYARLDAWELSGMYADLYSNLNVRLYNEADDYFGYQFLSMGVPVPFVGGGVGASWIQFNTVFYQENSVTVSYGKRLWEPHTLDSGFALDVGVSFKMLHWKVDGIGEDIAAKLDGYGTEKYGYTADVGVLTSVLEKFKIGLSVDNIIPINVGMIVEEIVPAVYRVGAAYTYAFPRYQEWLDSIMVTSELSLRNNVYLPKVGFESWWFNHFAGIRVGINQDRFTSGFSFVFGGGVDSDLVLQLDYAFSYPFQLADSLGTHRVGMTVSWASLEQHRDDELRRTLKIVAAANEVIRAAHVAQQEVQKIKNILQEIKQVVQTTQPGKARKIRHTLEKSEDVIITAKLQAKLAVEKATESSEKIKDIAYEAVAAVRKIELEIDRMRHLAEELYLAEKIQEITQPLREKSITIVDKYPNKIVVGIEKKVITDYGDLRKINIKTKYLKKYIKKTSDMHVEWKIISPTEMQLGLRQGEIDILVLYESDFSEFIEARLMQPKATIQSHGKSSQRCCLVVLTDGEIKSIDDLQGKRVGYSNIRLKNILENDIFQTFEGFSANTYFKSLEKNKNARDSLGALQMHEVDAIVEYEYILDVVANESDPPDVKIIAQSKSKPNTCVYVVDSQNKSKNEKISKMLVELFKFHADPNAKEFFGFFRMERFVPVR
jgi:ABC-type phosphate/phosphonate transport system substrate-binding protein